MSSYHVIRIDNNTNRSMAIGERGLTAEQAIDDAARRRQERPAGSSIDYRTERDR